MIRVDLNMELEISGPFLTQSSAPGVWGLDACLARDAGGVPYLPGTLVAGKLRQAWEELNSMLEEEGSRADCVPDRAAIGDLLGDSAGGKGLEPAVKQLLIGDFPMISKGGEGSEARYRVRMDEARGAVQEQALMMLESPFAPGEMVRFAGTITFLACDEAQARHISAQIEAGMQWTDQLGAYRTLGFGRLRGITLCELRLRGTQRDDSIRADILDLVIAPDSPFCVDADTPSSNLFYSSEIIPGNVILGTLFNMLERQQRDLLEDRERGNGDASDPFGKLREHFRHLRVRHAFPSDKCQVRPVTMPLSLVTAAGDTWDVALEEKARLIRGQAPAFAPDWKDTGPRSYFGWPELGRELRVRTAIDRKKLRARDEQLFSYDMVRPGTACWHSRISLAGVPGPDRQAVGEQLQSLLSLGLLGFGKSKSTARVTVVPGGAIRPALDTGRVADRMGEDGLVCITLQTPALLLDPDDLDETSGQCTLRKAYRTTWQKISPSLVLCHFYARQTLAGGRYLARRRQGRGEGEAGYYPWVLTDAGSVFVFRVIDNDPAQAALEEWLRDGLPLADNVLTAYGMEGDAAGHWRNCPYVPHNGYGEIAINLDIHETWRSPFEHGDPIETIGEVCHD